MRPIIVPRYMPGQIHAVMQQSEDFDDLPLRFPENYKVAASSALSRHMQGANSRPNIIPPFGPRNFWTVK